MPQTTRRRRRAADDVPQTTCRRERATRATKRWQVAGLRLEVHKYSLMFLALGHAVNATGDLEKLDEVSVEFERSHSLHASTKAQELHKQFLQVHVEVM